MSRRCIVTGAGRGIGLAIVERFLQAGHEVWSVDLDPGEVLGERHHVVSADVRDADAAARLLAEVGTELDVLVNNAGVMIPKSAAETTEDDLDLLLSVNLVATLLWSRLALPLLRARQGNVVNMASQSGLIGRGATPAYAASKAAVVSLTKSLALAWGPEGVRVNAVAPGSIDTRMFTQILTDPEDEPAAVAAVTPLGRVGTAAEVASAVEFLAGAGARFITGQVLAVDGGRTAGMAEATHWNGKAGIG